LLVRSLVRSFSSDGSETNKKLEFSGSVTYISYFEIDRKKGVAKDFKLREEKEYSHVAQAHDTEEEAVFHQQQE